MFFTVLTFLTAFAIEGLGTLVSVIGLSTLFGSNPIIIALAIALDLGKLVVVTLLYKHWKTLGLVMKSYALVAAAVTMVITSAGAAGYLSGEFQKAIMGTQEGALKVDVLKGQIAKYEERKQQIDSQISALPEKTTVNNRIKLIDAFKLEQKDLQDKIAELDKQLPALQIAQIGVEAKAGPILYIAKAFDIPVESAVKYVILMIIFVFDPLAVFLIIAGNFLWDQRKFKKHDGGRDQEFKARETPIIEPSEPWPRKLFTPPMPPASVPEGSPVVESEPAQDPSPPIFEVLQPTTVTPEVLPELAPIVEPSVREVITREQLVPSTHFPAVSSLNAVKADDSVTFTDNPKADNTAYYKNLK